MKAGRLFWAGAALSCLAVLMIAANKVFILYGKLPDPSLEQLVRLGILPTLPILLVGAIAILFGLAAFRRDRGGAAWLLIALAPLLALAVRLWIVL